MDSPPFPVIYFESHITIDPLSEEERERATPLIQPHGFKLAKLLMQKRDKDTPEASKFDTFMTGHGTRTEQELIDRMVACIKVLKENGFRVRRYKIEACTLDSRHSDLLNLLTH